MSEVLAQNQSQLLEPVSRGVILPISSEHLIPGDLPKNTTLKNEVRAAKGQIATDASTPLPDQSQQPSNTEATKAIGGCGRLTIPSADRDSLIEAARQHGLVSSDDQ